MKSRKARLVALVTSVVAVGALATPANAQTPMTYEIWTAAEIPGGTGAFDFHMFPSELTAHPGDTLMFDSSSFGILATGETELPFAGFMEPDPDDNGIKVPGGILFPSESGVDCGTSAADPCIYDGTFLLVDGEQDYPDGVFVQIADSLDGSTFMASNLWHTLTVTVDSAAQQSPAQDPDMEAHLAEAAEIAEANFETLNTPHFETTPTGKRIYQAYMGYDVNGHISFFDAFPQNLKIRKGDKVEWHFDSVIEPHTASTPPQKAKKAGNNAFNKLFSFQTAGCDVDGDEGTSPDVAPDLEQPPFCSEGELELDVPGKFVNSKGDGKYPTDGKRDTDFEHSGVLGGAPGMPTDPYTLKFVRKSGGTPFTVMCAIHFFMKTKVTVK